MEPGRIQQIIRIAKLYYEMKMDQQDIANQEGISKSTVSRLLQKGMDRGYIKVQIEYPIESVTDLEEQLKQCFGLKEVFVTPALVGDRKLILKDVCRALAARLDQYIADGSVVGVSWGETMNCLAGELRKIPVQDVRVVQLNGGVPKHTISTGAARIVDSLSKACGGEGYLFPVPAIVDSREIADVLKQDSQVAHVLSLARRCDTTIFSVGAFSRDSILYRSGYFREEEYAGLQSCRAVGDICSRYFDLQGQIADPRLDGRVVGIPLEEIRRKKRRIAVASGAQKVLAILGALNGGIPNILYTDEATARNILKEYYDRMFLPGAGQDE